MIVLNFSGHILSEEAIAQLPDKPIGSVLLNVDFSKDIVEQIRDAFDKIDYDFNTPEQIAIVPPGLGSLASIIVAEIQGRTGQLPRIIVLSRDENKGIFLVNRVVDLEETKRGARSKRKLTGA